MPESNALIKFERIYDRAYGMVDRHFEIFKTFIENETDEEWDETHDDLFRTAIVLAVTAMDTYYTDRFCEGLIPYLKKHKLNANLTTRLEEAGFDTKTALQMFQMQRPHRRLSNLVRKKLGTFVTQNLAKVNGLYKGFGYKNFTQSAQGLARRKTLVASVQALVNRRNKIVHKGDYNSHGRLNEVDYSQTLRRMNDLRMLVMKCDQLLSKKKI